MKNTLIYGCERENLYFNMVKILEVICNFAL